MTERPDRQYSVSPINTPTQPTSEPPTPTTGHVSINNNNNNNAPYPSHLSQSSSAGKNKGDILMPLTWIQRSFPKSNATAVSSQHLSQFSITSSARSVKSMGSSIIDTDFENEADAPVPLAINAGNANVGGSTNNSNQEDDDLSQDPCPRDEISKDTNIPTKHGLQQDLLWEFLSDFKEATLSSIHDIRMQQKRDMDRLISMLQNESNRRQALEGRMHAQLLLQAETMVAMEVKLLKLEAKVEKRDFYMLKRKVSGGGGANNNNNNMVSSSSVNSGNQGGGQGNGHPGGNFPSLAHGFHQSINAEGRTGSIVANETIDEEESDEDFGMKDIKEIQVRTSNAANDAASGITQATSGTALVTGIASNANNNTTVGLDGTGVHHHGSTVGSSGRSGHHHVVVNSHSKLHSNRDRIHLNPTTNPTNIVMSSGISLASGVTATSFLEDSHGVVEYQQVDSPRGGNGDDDEDDEDASGASRRSNDGDVEDEGGRGDVIEEDASESTPTQGRSRRDYRLSDMNPVTNLESILLNPNQSPCPSELGLSTRAVRGDYDGNSSLATSITNTTVTSTIITSTTKGNDSTTRQAVNDSGIEVEVATAASGVSYGNDLVNSTASMSQRSDFMLALSPQPNTEDQERPPRNESPLTVQSGATETRSVGQSVASASVGTSILSTAAVAPARSFRARREAAARYGNYQDGRSLANRVVSFTSDQVFLPPPEISEAGDSITMPDELDNLSDVADEFASRARLWRDEYEARLDAIQKKWIGE